MVYEWDLLQDIRDELADKVPEFHGRVYVLSSERLMPESVKLPACGIVRGPTGTFDFIKGAFRETYDVDIWIYDRDFSGRTRAQESVSTLTSKVISALRDYAPVGSLFHVTTNPINLDAIRPGLNTETGEFVVLRRVRMQFTAIYQEA